MPQLTEQQLKFTHNYIRNGFRNATKAAMEAGYSPKTAENQGSRLLKHGEVKKILNKEKKKLEKTLSQTTEIKTQDLIAFWARYLQPGNPAKESEKLKASEYLARYLGVFNEAGKGENQEDREHDDQAIDDLLEGLEKKRSKR